MAATIRNSPLYERFQVLRLTQNMRVLGSEEEVHRQWLRDLGNGRNFIDDKNLFVEVPEELMVLLRETGRLGPRNLCMFCSTLSKKRDFVVSLVFSPI
jgi:hypothetical protein